MTNLTKSMQLIKDHVSQYLSEVSDGLEENKLIVDCVDIDGLLDDCRIYIEDNEKFITDFGFDNMMNVVENESINRGESWFDSLFDGFSCDKKGFSFYRADNFIMGVISQNCIEAISDSLLSLDSDFDIHEDELTAKTVAHIKNDCADADFLNKILRNFKNEYSID